MANKIFGFGFVFYPFEHDDVSIEKICDTLFPLYPCAISPLHSPDGKKPHYHVHIYCKLNNSQKASINILLRNKGNYAEELRSGQKSFDYLTHKGFPDKEQFPDGVFPRCSELFSADLFDGEVSEVDYSSFIFEAIREHDFSDICEVVDFFEDSDRGAFEFLFKHLQKFKSYVDSRRFKAVKYDEVLSIKNSEINRLNGVIRDLQAIIEKQNEDIKQMSMFYIPLDEKEVSFYDVDVN